MNEAEEKGLAYGVHQIRNDCIFFRFKDETWELPTFYVLPNNAKHNGCYYEAKPSRLRKLAKQLKQSKDHHG